MDLLIHVHLYDPVDRVAGNQYIVNAKPAVYMDHAPQDESSSSLQSSGSSTDETLATTSPPPAIHRGFTVGLLFPLPPSHLPFIYSFPCLIILLMMLSVMIVWMTRSLGSDGPVWTVERILQWIYAIHVTARVLIPLVSCR